MNASDLLEQARQFRRDGNTAECIATATAAACAGEYERDWDVVYNAHACIGRLHMSRAEPDLALGPFRNALDAAKEMNPRERLAGAYHDLSLALRESGNGPAAIRKAGTAMDLYADLCPRHPGFTGLVADIAQQDFDRHPTCKERAGKSFRTWVPVAATVGPRRYRLAAAAQQMHAAAVLGTDSRYQTANDLLERVYGSLPHFEHAALTLAYASRAASLHSDYERAAVLADRAERIAESRGEDRVAEIARETRADALAERTVAE